MTPDAVIRGSYAKVFNFAGRPDLAEALLAGRTWAEEEFTSVLWNGRTFVTLGRPWPFVALYCMDRRVYAILRESKDLAERLRPVLEPFAALAREFNGLAAGACVNSDGTASFWEAES